MYDTLEDILDLSCGDARLFFLKRDSYCNLDLPEYFDFQPILDKMAKAVGGKSRHDIVFNHGKSKKDQDVSKDPRNIERINYKLYHNKDGKYAWRPFEFIHPAMYVCLVNVITEEDNWTFIVNRLRKIQTDFPQIECVSLPLSHGNDPAKTSETVLNWWNQIEQRSLALSIKYEYLLNTDITNCYGSIYTHSIVWALHDREVVKADVDKYHGVGDDIDSIIQSMSYKQTNGIPQGSVLMDFVAEIVLAYADKLLGESLNGVVENYKILRYRDDYRIFTNSKEDADFIGKTLSGVLETLNLKINSQKTFLSEDIITDSIKKDKWYWIQSKHSSDTLQKQLLIIYSLSRLYPNSGSLKRALADYYKRISKVKKIKEDIIALIGIIIDIAKRNPGVYPITTSILGRLFQEIDNRKTLCECIDDIKSKFSNIPNTGYFYLWLQRVSYKIDDTILYPEPMCDLVMDYPAIIWDSTWLKERYRKIMDNADIIDRTCLSSIPDLVPTGLVTLGDDWIS